MTGGTALGKVNPDGTVCYIIIGHMSVEDVFNNNLITSSEIWNKHTNYTFCPLSDYFLTEKFKEDKTEWRITIDTDGSIQIRQDELNGAPKPEILTSPVVESIEVEQVNTLKDDLPTNISVILDIPPPTITSVTLDIPPLTVTSVTLDVPPPTVTSITPEAPDTPQTPKPIINVPEIPTSIIKRSFWSRFFCAGLQVA